MIDPITPLFPWTRWQLPPEVALGLAVILLSYLVFVGPLRPDSAAREPLEGWRIASFSSGVLILFVALTGPLGDLAGTFLFSAHMVQHLLLTVVAPPLLLFGTPAWLKGGASFMTNISNDAWFGRTNGPWQHLSMLPLRAVENRVAIARAANTGVSALVEPTGRITQTLPLFTSGILQGSIATRRRTTIYTGFGDWFAYTCLALSPGFLGASAWVRCVRGPTRG